MPPFWIGEREPEELSRSGGGGALLEASGGAGQASGGACTLLVPLMAEPPAVISVKGGETSFDDRPRSGACQLNQQRRHGRRCRAQIRSRAVQLRSSTTRATTSRWFNPDPAVAMSVPDGLHPDAVWWPRSSERQSDPVGHRGLR
jgi:hypothetical protein